MASSLGKVSRSVTLRVVAKQLPAVSCAQYHHKVMVRKPKPMARRVFDEIMKPLYDDPPEYLKGSCLDPNKEQEEEITAYEQFLVRQLQKEIESSKMIIICHSLPSSAQRTRFLQLQLRNEGMNLRQLSNKHMTKIIEGTKLANLAPLLTWHNYRITSPEANVKTLVAKLRKFPEFVPLGGFVEDRLVSREDLVAMSKMPDLDQQRGQLVAILNQMGGAKTLSLLNHHQQRLSVNLDQYQKQLQEAKS